jgi:hypothetical protein
VKKDVKEKWVKALRSGEYKQGMGTLKREDKYCCLGVLCDLHAKETGKTWYQQHSYAFTRKIVSRKIVSLYEGAVTEVPNSVAEWAGFSELDPKMDPKIGLRHATQLNDNGYSFEQIADLIEENL